jgi:hypothetical protein
VKKNVIGQVKLATNNPVALLLGCLLGGFIPLATYVVAHQTVQNWVTYCLIAGGLIYSAKTVWQWGRVAFDCPYKATGFVLLTEGVMVTSAVQWLSIAALAYLIAINAGATGCQLALKDLEKPKPKKAKPSELHNFQSGSQRRIKPANKVA